MTRSVDRCRSATTPPVRPAARQRLCLCALACTLALGALFAAAQPAHAGDPAAKAARAHRCEAAGLVLAPGTSTNPIERALLCLINERRARAGLPPVRVDRCLDRAAERHARAMVARRFFAHGSRNGRSPADRARAAGYVRRATSWFVAENIAWAAGAETRPIAVVRGWMRSPGHRRNILGRFRHVGISAVHGAPDQRALGFRARATFAIDFGARTPARGCGPRTRRGHRDEPSSRGPERRPAQPGPRVSPRPLDPRTDHVTPRGSRDGGRQSRPVSRRDRR